MCFLLLAINSSARRQQASKVLFTERLNTRYGRRNAAVSGEDTTVVLKHADGLQVQQG
jgi:hypothetical protein